MKQRQYLFLIFLQIFIMLGLSVSYAQAPPIAGQSAANNQQQILNSLGYNPAKPIAPVSHQWLKSIGTDGGPTLAQPDVSDVTNALSTTGDSGTTTTTAAGGNTAISSANRAALNGLNVKDLGGAFSGTSNDSLAFQRTYNATPQWGTINIPYGGTSADVFSPAYTATITIASPGVITAVGMNPVPNQGVIFSTTGALPTGLVAGTTYYAVPASINSTNGTFQVAATANGSAINTSGAQSGTQTATIVKNVVWNARAFWAGANLDPTGAANAVQYLGDGDIYQSFNGGRLNLNKQIIHSTNTFAIESINLDNQGGVTGNVTGGLRINANSYASSSGFTWPFLVSLNAGATGGGNTQDVAISSLVTRPLNAAGATWQYYGQTQDDTGLPPTSSSAIIILEDDIRSSGPEDTRSAYDPGNFGGRSGFDIFIGDSAKLNVNWSASLAIPGGSNGRYTILPSTANGFIYRDTVGNCTTGSTEPTWPTSAGTVTDGTCTWSYGTTTASMVSRLINFNTSENAEIGAGFLTAGKYYDAVLDASSAVLTPYNGSKPAIIRLPPNGPIDWSAGISGLSLANQNIRTTLYNSTSGNWEYQVSQAAKFSISDVGNITAAGSSTLTGGVGVGGAPVAAQALSLVGSSFTNGLNLSNGTFSGSAIILAGAQKLSWEATGTIREALAAGNILTIYNGATLNWQLDQSGNETVLGIISGSVLRSVPTTLASLGSCISGTEGRRGAITDATAVTAGATLTGGGSLHAPAYCNGTNWITY